MLATSSVRSLPRTALRACSPYRLMSIWAHVQEGPKDPILGVTEAFNADKDPRKLNLGVGAYRDDNGKPVILESVKRAQQIIVEHNMNHEYGPIAGTKEFVSRSLALAYGSHPVLQEGRVAGLQALSGTGALRLAGAFLQRFSPATVYIPTPTWGNHTPIFKDAGLPVHHYKYYDPSTKGLNLNGMLDDLRALPDKQVILLHACAHNPTGVDPNPQQWKEISKVLKQKHHFVLLDMAYQGFASGDPVQDALALRTLLDDGHLLALCQSFAKNFGLYGQRVGTLSFVTASAQETARVESQLKILARAMYSNPPVHGARIVSIILGDAHLREQWAKDVKQMADRIILMRSLLKKNLQQLGSKHNWEHITNQIGMFCYTGLSPQQVERLISEFHIYMTSNGRISMAGVTSKDVAYLAESIHEVTK